MHSVERRVELLAIPSISARRSRMRSGTSATLWRISAAIICRNSGKSLSYNSGFPC
jgi:hypothetical protein